MPELPDAECFKRYLDATSLHQKIEKVRIGRDDMLRDVSRRELARALTGRRFAQSRRHGKYLAATLDDGTALVLHFGMTGFLEYFKRDGHDPPHARLCFDFDNGYRLVYDSRRLLGAVMLADDFRRFVEEKQLGPDALGLDRAGFRECLGGRRGMLKPTLMNQRIMAGLGNVYTDEILFHARLHPRAGVSDLAPKDSDRLFRNMRHVLRKAIAVKADPARVPAAWLLPHRESGAPCPRGNGRIRRIRVGGRATYYCPHCQGR